MDYKLAEADDRVGLDVRNTNAAMPAPALTVGRQPSGQVSTDQSLKVQNIFLEFGC